MVIRKWNSDGSSTQCDFTQRPAVSERQEKFNLANEPANDG